MDGWMDGWMDGQVKIFVIFCTSIFKHQKSVVYFLSTRCHAFLHNRNDVNDTFLPTCHSVKQINLINVIFFICMTCDGTCYLPSSSELPPGEKSFLLRALESGLADCGVLDELGRSCCCKYTKNTTDIKVMLPTATSIYFYFYCKLASLFWMFIISTSIFTSLCHHYY